MIASFSVFRIDPTKFKWESLLNPWLLFILNVLITLFACYLIVALSMGILNPKQIAEFEGTLFGLSFKNKYYETREAEVKKLENNTKIAENQFENIVTLNRNIFDLILKSYEGYILNAINQADAIRQLVCDVLVKSYSKYPNIKIHVVPLTEKGYSLLDSKTAAFVRLLALENKPLSIIEDDTIGISIIHGFDDLSVGYGLI